MVQYVITPWRNRSELLSVRQQLYPSSKESINDSHRRHAVDKVSVWMQRGNCPHLVESSALLTSAKLNDVPGNSSYCIRAAYSAAFSRFVTGLLDSHQDKRRKLSMYSIAKTIGLPATFVELRHQATHEELPSLPKLRTATEKALQWIWDYYWANLTMNPPLTQDCQRSLEQLLKGNVEYSDEQLKVFLSQWGAEDVQKALREISTTTSDADLLLASLRLSRKLMNGFLEQDGQDLEKEEESRDLNAVKTKLARIREDLTDSGNEAEQEGHVTADQDDSSGMKGWSLWEGSWTPQPIGTIS